METEPIFDDLQADPLYRRLCKNQQCFRARLTPKPWRCGLPPPSVRWPWPEVKAEEAFKRWDRHYRKACETLATCELLATLGRALPHADIQPLLQVHDEITRVSAKLPLA